MDDQPNEPIDDARRAGAITIARRLLMALAILSLVGSAVGLVLVQRLGTTYRDGLEVTKDAADVAAANAASAVEIANNVSALAKATADTLDNAQGLVTVGATSLEGLGTAMGTNLAAGIEGTASIAGGVAGLIGAIEFLIPGNSKSLGEDLSALADGLQPVPDQLRTLGKQLDDTAQQLTAANGSLDSVTAQLTAVSTSIDEAAVALAQVDALARDLEQRAQDALDRSNLDLWLFRILILIVGLGVSIVCFVSYRALGRLNRERRSVMG